MIPAHRWTETSGATLLQTYDPNQRWEFTWPDGTVRVVIDNPAYDFHVVATAQALAAVLTAVRLHMERIGFEPMDAEECEPELLDDGCVRIYYVPIESYGDDGDYAMPSLAETGFGVYSMEIPVITTSMIEEDVKAIPAHMIVTEDDIPTDIRPALPPLPYAPSTTRRYESTTTGPKPRGRHRAMKRSTF